jgi:DNA mismatch repair ATPase MutS
MKVHLMFADRDVDPRQLVPGGREDVMQDLDLPTLLNTMADGDDFILDVCQQALLTSLDDPAEICYRQRVLADCENEPAMIRELYDVAVSAISAERRVFGFFRDRPAQLLHRSVEVLGLFLEPLKTLRRVADNPPEAIQSEGLLTLFATLRNELDDAYFGEIAQHLAQLKFRRGLMMSTALTTGNRASEYVLRTPGRTKQSWKQWLGLEAKSAYSFEIAPRDEAGSDALQELRDRGLDPVANAVAQSADHVLSFFTMLRSELGFYLGCLNLEEALAKREAPLCVPTPVPWKPETFAVEGLYDLSLRLRSDGEVIGNSVSGDGVSLFVITGANSGGKSTFLRSVGIAQLMMQCGMFVPASSFRASVCDAVFCHFIREEDDTMSRGRLDDELSRMNQIADQITSRSLILFNESFAATNEREGSEIARQILHALTERGVKAFIVTHLFDLANGFVREGRKATLYLRAEREKDGQRTFRLQEAPPLSTSFGEDLYRRLGAWDTQPRSTTAAKSRVELSA